MKKLILGLLMVLGMMGLVWGVGSFDAPAIGGTISGAVYNINITGIAFSDLRNCSVSGSSSASGGSFTADASNSTGVADEANVTVNSFSYVDAADYVVSATCYNSSGGTETITSSTGVIVDNTNPICSFASALVGNAEYKPTQTWTITGTNATSATIAFGGNTPLSMSESSDIFTYTGTKTTVPSARYGTVLVTTSDGTDSTTCSISNVNIDNDATVVQVAIALTGAGKKTGDTGTNFNDFLPWIIGGAVLWFIFKKK